MHRSCELFLERFENLPSRKWIHSLLDLKAKFKAFNMQKPIGPVKLCFRETVPSVDHCPGFAGTTLTISDPWG